MYPILFKLGPLTIYTYGFFVCLGVLAGYFVARWQAKLEGINKNVFDHLIFWTIFFSFLGAKLLYIVIEFKYFLKSPLGVIRTGFVFYGGIIFGIITLYFLTKKYKINFLKFVDIVVIGVPLAHAFGRFGCFFYGCCYGKPTNSFIGVLFPPASPAGLLGVKVIPAQLISAFFLFIIFFILLRIRRRKRFNGQVFLSYFIVYGTFRFIIEFFRGDPRGPILFLSTSQFISVLFIAISILLWQRFKRAS